MEKYKFDNVYGSFKLTKGERYDFTVVDVESGDALPIYDAEVIGETDDAVLIKKFGCRSRIQKSVIADENLNTDTYDETD